MVSVNIVRGTGAAATTGNPEEVVTKEKRNSEELNMIYTLLDTDNILCFSRDKSFPKGYLVFCEDEKKCRIVRKIFECNQLVRVFVAREMK